MDIDGLMKRFMALSPTARAGHGPEHPTLPNTDLAVQTMRWLALHRFLSNDSGYVSFLKRYSGALIDAPLNAIGIDIAGFSGVSSYLHEIGMGVFDDTVLCIDHFGFYNFGTASFNERGGWYYFDATGLRPWGVYEGVLVENAKLPEPKWFCESFSEWLESFISKKESLQMPRTA